MHVICMPQPEKGQREAMTVVPDAHELARQLAVLEERMNTIQAEYRTDIARLAEDMAKRDVRSAQDRWWQTAIVSAVVIGAVAVATSILLGQ